MSSSSILSGLSNIAFAEFDPGVLANGGTFTETQASRVARYAPMGEAVAIILYITGSQNPSNANYYTIELPFAAADTPGGSANQWVSLDGYTASTPIGCRGFIQDNGTTMRIYKEDESQWGASLTASFFGTFIYQREL